MIKGQKSIDNEYLFIAITSGLYNLAIYVTLIIAVLVRLLLFAVRHRYDSPQGQLAWVLIAAWISAIFTQATAYSGMQTTHYFFMIAAISEALVLTKGQAFLQLSPSIKEVSKEIQNGYNFSRTL